MKSGESVELREAKVARESAEKRVLDLEIELEKLRSDYAKLRSKYAGLYVDTFKTVKELRSIELSAANLVQSRELSSQQKQALEAMETLELVLHRQIELRNAITSYRDYIAAALDILQPSQAVKDEIGKREQALATAMENSLKPLAAAALKDSASSASKCAVLAVNGDAGVVILDKGALLGVRPGEKWILEAPDGSMLARLVTVEVRPDLSAAVQTEGSMGNIRPGAILVKDK